MIQEYFTPSGTGKSYSFIPNQVETNLMLGCKDFYVIGLTEPVLNYRPFFGLGKTKKILLSVLQKKKKFLNIKFLNICDVRQNNDILDIVDEFLKNANTDSNIIIDEVGVLVKNSDELNRIKRYSTKCKFLTLVAQDSKQFYSLLN